MIRKSPVILIFAFLILLSISCKDKTKESSQQPGSEKKSETTARQKSEEGFIIKMINNGSEPRRILKYNFEKEKEEKGKFIMNMDLQMTMSGRQTPKFSSPPIVMPIKMMVKDLNESGTAIISYDMGQIIVEDASGVDPKVVESLRTEYKKLESINCSAEVESSGTYSNTKCNYKGQIDPNLTKNFDQLMENFNSYVFFPDEPVGVGAKWEIAISSFEYGGIDSEYSSTIEIEDIKEDLVEIIINYDQNAGEQIVNDPSMNTSVKIKSLKARGTGNLEIDLNELIPKGNISTESETVTSVDNGQGQEDEVISIMNLNFEMVK